MSLWISQECWEQAGAATVFTVDCAAYSSVESVMRAVRLLLTVSGFLTYFTAIIALSALTTGVVHSAFSTRPGVPISLQD